MNALIHCIGEVGMRPAEAVALRWQDINPDANQVSVAASTVRTSGHRGARVVQLFPEAGRLLEALLLRRAEGEYVFRPASADRPMSLDAIRRYMANVPNSHRRRSMRAIPWLQTLRYQAAVWMLTPPPFGPGLSYETVAHQLGVTPAILSAILRNWRGQH